MNNLITNDELELLAKLIIKSIDKDNKHYLTIYHKLISNYKYYKNRVSELELEIEDLLNKDFDV